MHLQKQLVEALSAHYFLFTFNYSSNGLCLMPLGQKVQSGACTWYPFTACALAVSAAPCFAVIFTRGFISCRVSALTSAALQGEGV